MDIILDANIIRRDLKLNDQSYQVLVDYLKRTNSRLIYPSIVIEEVKGLYKRVLSEKYQDFLKSKEKLESTLLFTDMPTIPEIDIDSELYIDFLHAKLGTDDDNIIPYKNEYLPELVKRAIERRKPLDDKGQQFRDGLLWLTMLDYAQSIDEKRITFISDNPKDFSEKGENQLAKQLHDEAISLGVEIKYFKRLSDFVREHASVIDFITTEWVKSNIDIDIIESLFDEVLSERQEEKVLGRVRLETNESKTGNISKIGFVNSTLSDFYVYEKSDGVILLNIDIEFETEYEVEIERILEKDSSDYDYIYTTNPKTGEPEMDVVFVPKYSHEQEFVVKNEYPLYRGEYVLTIVDGIIKNYELKDWDWG